MTQPLTRRLTLHHTDPADAVVSPERLGGYLYDPGRKTWVPFNDSLGAGEAPRAPTPDIGSARKAVIQAARSGLPLTLACSGGLPKHNLAATINQMRALDSLRLADPLGDGGPGVSGKPCPYEFSIF